MRARRFAALLVSVALVMLCVACTGAEDVFIGTWHGSVEEERRSHELEFWLRWDARDELSGMITMLSENGGDVRQGDSFLVQELTIDGDSLSFIVPITGVVDDDTLEFALVLERGRLVGTGKERRGRSPELPVVLTRQD